MDDLTILAAMTAVATLAIREAFAFAWKATRRNGSRSSDRRSLVPSVNLNGLQQRMKNLEDKFENKVVTMSSQINDLHIWHAKTDQDGVPIWYVRRSLEDAIEKLAENIKKQTEVFTQLIWEIRQNSPKSSGSPVPPPTK